MAALAVALVLRLGFAVGYWRGKPLTHDEQEYLALALNLAAGRGFTTDLAGALEGPNVERFSRAPLYPALLAMLFTVTGADTDRLPIEVPRSVQVAQSAAGTIGVWVIALLARRIGGESASAVAALLAAVYPPLVWIPAYALSEAVYSPMVLGSALLLTRAAGPDLGRVAASGLLAGLSALVRSSALAFVPLAAVWLAWRRRPAAAVVLLATAAAAVAPWSARNVREHGRLIIVAADGGVTFWTGNHPLAIGEGDLAANPQLKYAQRAFLAAHPGLGPEALEPLYYRDALETIAGDPLWWLGLELRKLLYVWLPLGPSYRLHSPLYFWGSVIPYALVMPVAVVGLLRVARRRTPEAAPLLLLAMSAVALSLVFFPQERFRIPVLDPAYLVLASSWIGPRLERA